MKLVQIIISWSDVEDTHNCIGKSTGGGQIAAMGEIHNVKAKDDY